MRTRSRSDLVDPDPGGRGPYRGPSKWNTSLTSTPRPMSSARAASMSSNDEEKSPELNPAPLP